MRGKLGLGVVVALFALLAAPAPAAQDDDDVDWNPWSHQCSLSLVIDEQGTASITLVIQVEKSSDVRPKEVEQALNKVFGDSLRDVRRQKISGVTSVTARAEKVFPPEDGVIEGDLDLSPLAELLQAKGLERLDVSIMAMPRGPSLEDLQRLRPKHYHVSTASPEPVHFVLDHRPPEWTRPAGILAGLFLVPIGLVFWRRWAALRAAGDPAVAWYRFWRWVHWITLGTWGVWLTGMAVLRGRELFLFSLPGTGGYAIDWIVTLAPPWLVMLLCGAVSQEVFARLSKADITKTEILRRTASGLAVKLIPLLLVLVGLWALIEQRHQAAVAWLFAAWGVRMAGAWLASGQQSLTPHAVTTGELRDRIFTMARQAGVILKQLYILPTGKMRQANAFALRGQSVIITDHLLQSLSRREVDAIAAHELGHLKYRHHTWLLAIVLGVLFVGPMIWGPILPIALLGSSLRYLPVGLVLALVIFYFVSRRFELQTDSYAAWLTGDPEALITGLIRVHKLNLMPMRWGKWEEGLLTHPSTDRRLEAIARHNGISRQRLEELVNETQTGADQPLSETYGLPQELSGQDLIFSTALKLKYRKRIGRAHLAAVLLVPGLFAAGAWWAGLTGPVVWGVLACGLILTGLTVIVLDNYSPLWAYSEVRRRLNENMKSQGLDSAAAGGIFVGFAPDSSLKLYEGYTNWDFGFLFLQADRLCYVGEQTRFALRRDQVTSTYLGPSFPRWWPSSVLYITWVDQGRGGTFNLRSGEARSMRQMGRETLALEQLLRRWQSGDSQVTEPSNIPPGLTELASPAIGEVTAAPLQALRKPPAWLRDSGLIFLLGIALSVLLGLPLRPDEGGIGWYTPAVAFVTFWVLRLPLLTDRRFWKST
jgi:STE24 endopeptidase